ncbi:hypothetical protein [Roseivirga sp. 4D4]|uniref:hypothetical protein n=1 Tax=Roseivirga sp. 4D4 TaxID=1889784 RepID=UPI001112F966|nr:hypothetical protein [Roseivirga sp. 4D4]
MTSKTSKSVYLFIAITGFILSFLWENQHFTLYANYAQWMEQVYFVLCSLADVLLIFLVYFLVALIFRNPYWIHHLAAAQILTTLLISALVSFLAEKIALYMNWWTYTDQMPLVPFLNIGLSPFLAITLLPVLTFLFSRKINQIF